MSIASEIGRISQAKSDLAGAIESKGVTVPQDATIDDYPALVQQISQGGGLPAGGTPGQMLYQGESGAEWGDKPVMLLKFTDTTGLAPGPLTAPDKTPVEIAKALTEEGFAVVAELTMISGVEEYIFYGYSALCQYYEDVSVAQVTIYINYTPDTFIVIIGAESYDGEITWELDHASASASQVRFSNYNTGLTSTNVQNAIKEVNTKATRKAILISIPTTGWTDNQQTFTVTGIPSDPTTYEVHLSQVGATNVSAAMACGLYIADEAANSLTLAVSSVPEAAFQVYAVVQGVSV